MLRLLLPVLLVLSAQSAARAQQPGPLKGIVWQQPEDVDAALSELAEMDSIGVEAVRTGPVRDERLLALADRLGIHVFQELPVAYLTAEALQDTVGHAQAALAPLLAAARRHPSARYFGLARMSDTSNPASCTYFEQLTEYVHNQGPPGAQTYYVTPFVEQDRCASAVDLVLLNASDAAQPAQLVHAWRAHHDSLSTQAGIGVLGTWVNPGESPGSRSPHGAQAQARYLETQLNLLLHGRVPVRPAVVFVYTWQDHEDGGRLGMGGYSPMHRTYGLNAPDGTPRPAYEVVQGIYGGTQRVFALDLDAEQPVSWPWRALLGWGAITLLGVFYAASPRLRFMIPRYFTAHGFYRDAVREGRDVLAASSAALLGILAVTSGLVLMVTLDQVSGEPSFAVLLRLLGEPAREFLLSLVERPWMTVLLCASVYALSAILWAGLLALLSRRRYVLAPAQTMMLVVWPRWPLILLLFAAMVIPSLPAERALEASLVCVGVWLLVTVFTLFRTLYDFASISRVPVVFVLLAWLTSPLMLLLVALGAAVLMNEPEVRFLFSLATQQ